MLVEHHIVVRNSKIIGSKIGAVLLKSVLTGM